MLPRWLRVNQLLDYVEAVHPGFRRARALELLASDEADDIPFEDRLDFFRRMRRKLDPDDRSRWIQTVRGVGYRFTAEAEE